jgi:hypothetical protein
MTGISGWRGWKSLNAMNYVIFAGVERYAMMRTNWTCPKSPVIVAQCLGVLIVLAVSACAARPAAQQAGALPVSGAAPLLDPSTNKLRVPHVKPAPGAVFSMSVKELGNFPFDSEKDLTVPDDVLALNGIKITLYGYVVPVMPEETWMAFALIPSGHLDYYDYGLPAPHLPPGVQLTVICHSKPQQKLEPRAGEAQVTGTLTVNPLRDNDFTHTIFQLDVDSIATAPLIDPFTHKVRVPHPKPQPGVALAMTIHELGNFYFDPNAADSLVPGDVLALDGVKITLPDI